MATKLPGSQNPGLFLTAFLILLAGPLLGGTITWTNASSDVWSTAINWSPNQVPGTNDIALITNTGTYTVTQADLDAGSTGARTGSVV